MGTLKNKIDFAVVFTVHAANPNGDPMCGNRPRTTLSGMGEVSDVCLKRKLRNRLQDAGIPIFVQSDDRRTDDFRSMKDRANGNEKLLDCLKQMNENHMNSDDYARIACETWFDVRAFGQIFAFKAVKKTNEETAAVSIGIRGPVSIQPAFSISPISVTSEQIVKSVNLETGNDPDKKGSDTMGTKYRVDFGTYVSYGSINVQGAKKTGFSEQDAEALKEALRTLFRNDESSARPAGSMEVVKVIWWKHNCANGQYSSAKVHRSLQVIPNNEDVPDIKINTDIIPNLSFEEIDGE